MVGTQRQPQSWFEHNCSALPSSSFSSGSPQSGLYDLINRTIYTTVRIHKDHHVQRPRVHGCAKRSEKSSGVPNNVACFLCRLLLLHGCCTLSSALCTLMGRALASPGLRTMAPLFHRPVRQLKETPIREASISGVKAPGSRTSTALVYVCKANQNTAAENVSSSPPLGRSKRWFCQSQMSATN